MCEFACLVTEHVLAGKDHVYVGAFLAQVYLFVVAVLPTIWFVNWNHEESNMHFFQMLSATKKHCAWAWKYMNMLWMLIFVTIFASTLYVQFVYELVDRPAEGEGRWPADTPFVFEAIRSTVYFFANIAWISASFSIVASFILICLGHIQECEIFRKKVLNEYVASDEQ